MKQFDITILDEGRTNSVICTILKGDGFTARLKRALEEEYNADINLINPIDFEAINHHGNDMTVIEVVEVGQEPYEIELTVEPAYAYAPENELLEALQGVLKYYGNMSVNNPKKVYAYEAAQKAINKAKGLK